ncbi:MAG: hypothetical protein ACRDO2_14270 [Nocardioidaceae bacterium]
MNVDQHREAVAASERWFVAHGLPYFVHGHNTEVREALRLTRLVPVATTAVVLALVAGAAFGWWRDDLTGGIAIGSVVLGLVLLGYALGALKVASIIRWAVGQTFGSLNWVFPLITRALPLLLLFITFLFINTEVWQVASSLDRGLLWLTVLLFATVAVAFLLVRLPEEVRAVRDDARGERLRTLCAGTPVESVAADVAGSAEDVRLGPLQRANLVLVLLFSQALQVALLSLAVFVFFLVFGNVAISDSVVESWLGEGHPSDLPTASWLPVSNELFQVSTFLAAFSGLYFTVYAVTDQTYREQFFTSITRDLERAVGVATVYRTLLR